MYYYNLINKLNGYMISLSSKLQFQPGIAQTPQVLLSNKAAIIPNYYYTILLRIII